MQLDKILALLKARLAETASGTNRTGRVGYYATRDTARTHTREITLTKLYDFSHSEQFGKNGAYWRGRRPKDGDMGIVATTFTQDDCISPALWRCVSAICNKDWDWDTKPDSERNLTSDEEVLEDALTVWHYDTQLGKVVARALYLSFAMSRSCLRMYIPEEYSAPDDGTQSELDKAGSLSEALELIHVHVIDARDGGALRDDHGREVGYYYLYSKPIGEQQVPHVELHTPEWIYQFKHEGDTFTAVLEAVNGVNVQYQRRNPLYDPARKRKPRYMMFEIDRGASMVTPDAIDKQSRLNVSWTNLARNDDLGGFRSGYTINADNPVEVDGEGREREAEWTIAPDLMLNIIGAPKTMGTDSTGREAVLERYTPEIGFIDPVNPESFLKAIDAYKAAIASAFDQGFTLQEFKATSSLSKKEDKSAFYERVTAEAQHAIAAGVWLLETATAYASSIVGEREGQKYAKVSFSPKFSLAVPKGDLDALLALMPAYKDNLVSLDTLLQYSPAEDKAAEEQKLKNRAVELEAAEVQRRKDALELARRGQVEPEVEP